MISNGTDGNIYIICLWVEKLEYSQCQYWLAVAKIFCQIRQIISIMTECFAITFNLMWLELCQFDNIMNINLSAFY